MIILYENIIKSVKMKYIKKIEWTKSLEKTINIEKSNKNENKYKAINNECFYEYFNGSKYWKKVW